MGDKTKQSTKDTARGVLVTTEQESLLFPIVLYIT